MVEQQVYHGVVLVLPQKGLPWVVGHGVVLMLPTPSQKDHCQPLPLLLLHPHLPLATMVHLLPYPKPWAAGLVMALAQALVPVPALALELAQLLVLHHRRCPRCHSPPQPQQQPGRLLAVPWFGSPRL